MQAAERGPKRKSRTTQKGGLSKYKLDSEVYSLEVQNDSFD